MFTMSGWSWSDFERQHKLLQRDISIGVPDLLLSVTSVLPPSALVMTVTLVPFVAVKGTYFRQCIRLERMVNLRS